MNTEFKLIDVISYVFIIGLIIYFLFEIDERNKLIYLDAQLRLRSCGVNESNINNIISNFTKGNYSALSGIGTEPINKNNPFNIPNHSYTWIKNLTTTKEATP
jgi:hypothetical protein